MPPPRSLGERRMAQAMQMPESPGVPDLMQAQAGDDMDPQNLEELQRTMKHRDMQDPRQQAALQQEQERLQQAQAKQQFSQRLVQRLNYRIGTPEDSDPQAAQRAFMTKLMMQMRQGGMR